MADGFLNKCKPCVRARIGEHRNNNIDRIRSYDCARAKNPRRIAHCIENTRRWRAKYPDRYRAHNALNNAIRDGKIIRGKCEICGIKEHVHAHHENYNEPLEVKWLCALHHCFHHNEESRQAD